MTTMQINGEEVSFFRADGTPAMYNVGMGGYDAKTGEVLFYEILDAVIGNMKAPMINGRNKYKRIFIRRVYPAVIISDDNQDNISETSE